MKARLIHADQATPVDVDTLKPHPGNARRGNVKLIAESLAVLGQYRPVVVNTGTHTGRPDEILAGHHLVMAAKELGWPQVSALYVDVPEDTATKIMLADNRTSDVAVYDEEALRDLLEGLPDLDGSGFSAADLDSLIEHLTASDGAEGAGDILEPGDDKYVEQYAVMVICRDEQHQQAIYEQLSTEGLNVKVVSV